MGQAAPPVCPGRVRREPPAARLRSPWPVVALLALGACKREPSPPVLVVDARPQATAPAAPTTPPAPTRAPDLAAPPGPEVTAGSQPGGDAAVEITGSIELPPGPTPAAPRVVLITVDDCLAPGAKVLRRVPVTDEDTFFAVIFAVPGSTLSVCAAAESAPGKPTAIYGKSSKPLVVGGAAAQEFRELSVVLLAGAPRVFSR